MRRSRGAAFGGRPTRTMGNPIGMARLNVGATLTTLKRRLATFQRHPELQRRAEGAMKLSPATIRWRSLPASEMADEPYILAHPELLDWAERAAFKAHLAARKELVQ